MIVCDDGSHDGTVDIIQKFAARVNFPVRLIINEKNLGTIKNFEKAIGLCSGEIIVLSDQDDVWHTQKLEMIEDIFLRTPDIGAVFSDAEIVDKQLNPTGHTIWQSIKFTEKEQASITDGRSPAVLVRHNVVTGATLAFRAEYKKYVLPIPAYCMHDMWIALIISMLSDLAIIQKPLVYYRQHPGEQIGASKDQAIDLYLKNIGHTAITGMLPTQWKDITLMPIEGELKIYESLQERVRSDVSSTWKANILDGKVRHMRMRMSASRKKSFSVSP